jgi:hypothetical protein
VNHHTIEVLANADLTRQMDEERAGNEGEMTYDEADAEIILGSRRRAVCD